MLMLREVIATCKSTVVHVPVRLSQFHSWLRYSCYMPMDINNGNNATKDNVYGISYGKCWCGLNVKTRVGTSVFRNAALANRFGHLYHCK